MEERHPTILVIEDDFDFCSALRDSLEEHGYCVLTAPNGAAGLQLMREYRHIALVVLDVTMPVMNGATFRGEQLADPELSWVPLVLVTGRADCATLERTMEATACLQKPFSLEFLLQTIRRHCAPRTGVLSGRG